MKIAPDGMIDAALDFVAGANYYCICSGSPATFADTYTNLMLARTPIASGSFTKADAAGGGRKITVAAKTGISITNSGTALAVGLVEASSSTLRYVTTCTSQALVAGGTVDTNAFVITIGDPT